MASTIFMGVHEQEIRNSKTSHDYDIINEGSRIGRGNFTIVKRISKGMVIARCKCGREFTRVQSLLKLVVSCGQCKSKSYIMFNNAKYKAKKVRYTKTQCEKLLMFWDSIEKFSKNVNDNSLIFPVLRVIDKHAVLVLPDGILIKEYFVNTIISEKQRIVDFLQ